LGGSDKEKSDRIITRNSSTPVTKTNPAQALKLRDGLISLEARILLNFRFPNTAACRYPLIDDAHFEAHISPNSDSVQLA
jgi:hypothetical protein